MNCDPFFENSPFDEVPTSKYFGVIWHEGKWVARISDKGESRYLGSFDDEIDAARMYDEHARFMGMYLNFGESDHAMGSGDLSTAATVGRLGPFGSTYEGQIELEVATGEIENHSSHLLMEQQPPAHDYLNYTYFESTRPESEAKLDPPVKRQRKLEGQNRPGVSRYKGVGWSRTSGKFTATIMVEGKNSHLGTFVAEDEAARAYDAVAGPLGRRTNFLRQQIDTRAALPLDHTAHVLKYSTDAKVGSQYVGVSQDEIDGRWISAITIDNDYMILGSFSTEVEAAKAYDERAAALLRPVNFPAAGSHQHLRRQYEPGTINLFRLVFLSTPFKVQATTESHSRHVGVTWNKPQRKWSASITAGGETHHLGFFKLEHEAARAYNEAAEPLNLPLNVFPTFADDGTDQDRTSQFVGVRRIPSQGKFKFPKWVSTIREGRRKIGLGTFETEIEAANAYDKAAFEKGRPVNFPENFVKKDVSISGRFVVEKSASCGPILSPLGVRIFVSSNLTNGSTSCANQLSENVTMPQGATVAPTSDLDVPQVHNSAAEPFLRMTSLSGIADRSYDNIDTGYSSSQNVSAISSEANHLEDIIEQSAPVTHISSIGYHLKIPVLSQAPTPSDATTVSRAPLHAVVDDADAYVIEGIAPILPKKASKVGASKYLGVCWYGRTSKWTASITVAKRNLHLGYYTTEEEAARKYDERAGPLGRKVNFPETAPVPDPVSIEEAASLIAAVKAAAQEFKLKDAQISEAALMRNLSQGSQSCTQSSTQDYRQIYQPDYEHGHVDVCQEGVPVRIVGNMSSIPANIPATHIISSDYAGGIVNSNSAAPPRKRRATSLAFKATSAAWRAAAQNSIALSGLANVTKMKLHEQHNVAVEFKTLAAVPTQVNTAAVACTSARASSYGAFTPSPPTFLETGVCFSAATSSGLHVSANTFEAAHSTLPTAASTVASSMMATTVAAATSLSVASSAGSREIDAERGVESVGKSTGSLLNVGGRASLGQSLGMPHYPFPSSSNSATDPTASENSKITMATTIAESASPMRHADQFAPSGALPSLTAQAGSTLGTSAATAVAVLSGAEQLTYLGADYGHLVSFGSPASHQGYFLPSQLSEADHSTIYALTTGHSHQHSHLASHCRNGSGESEREGYADSDASSELQPHSVSSSISSHIAI